MDANDFTLWAATNAATLWLEYQSEREPPNCVPWPTWLIDRWVREQEQRQAA